MSIFASILNFCANHSIRIGIHSRLKSDDVQLFDDSG